MSDWTDARKRLQKKGVITVNNKPNFNRMEMQAQQMANVQTLAPNILPGIKPNDLINVKCNNCSGEVFTPAHLLKFASRFMTRNGQPTMVQFPLGFMCATCQQINPFDIEQLQKVLQDGTGANDQDGQKLKETVKEIKDPAEPPDLGVSVGDGIKTKEKLN